MARTANKSKTEVAVTEEEVKHPQEGTAPAEEVKVTQDDTALPEDVVAVDNEGGLNLREGPGLSFQVLAIVPDGAQLTVIPLPCGLEVPGYAAVRYEGGEDGPVVGWINTDFVRED